MNKIFFSISTFFIILLTSCNSGSGNSSSGILSEEEARRVRAPVSSTLNLRLGQTSDSNSGVAVSAGLENGESITIFTPEDGQVGAFDVLYQSPNGDAILVTFDSTGRPTSAETSDAVVTFEGYTDTTVDVTLAANGISRFFDDQAIDLDVITFLEGDVLLEVLLGINRDVDSGTRSLLTFAFSSLRLVGCLAQDLVDAFSSFESFLPQVFESLGNNICKSELLTSISDIVEKSDYEEITVTDIEIAPECQGPRNFDNRRNCAKEVGEDVVLAAETKTVGTIEQIKPPINAKVARWTGLANPNTSLIDCEGFDIDFDVFTRGDATCRNPDCILKGILSQQDGPETLPTSGVIKRRINSNVSTAGFTAQAPPEEEPFEIRVTTRHQDGAATGTFELFQEGEPPCFGSVVLRRADIQSPPLAPAPSPPPFEGAASSWEGIAHPNDAIEDCIGFGIEFDAITQGDASCTLPACNVEGSIFQLDGSGRVPTSGLITRNSITETSLAEYSTRAMITENPFELNISTFHEERTALGTYEIIDGDDEEPFCVGSVVLRRTDVDAPPLPPPPSPPPFFGVISSWEGIANPNDSIEDCIGFSIEFDALSDGDPRCVAPTCSIEGEVVPNDFPENVPIDGEMTKNTRTDLFLADYSVIVPPDEVDFALNITSLHDRELARGTYEIIDGENPVCVGSVILRRTDIDSPPLPPPPSPPVAPTPTPTPP